MPEHQCVPNISICAIKILGLYVHTLKTVQDAFTRIALNMKKVLGNQRFSQDLFLFFF